MPNQSQIATLSGTGNAKPAGSLDSPPAEYIAVWHHGVGSQIHPVDPRSASEIEIQFARTAHVVFHNFLNLLEFDDEASGFHWFKLETPFRIEIEIDDSSFPTPDWMKLLMGTVSRFPSVTLPGTFATHSDVFQWKNYECRLQWLWMSDRCISFDNSTKNGQDKSVEEVLRFSPDLPSDRSLFRGADQESIMRIKSLKEFAIECEQVAASLKSLPPDFLESHPLDLQSRKAGGSEAADRILPTLQMDAIEELRSIRGKDASARSEAQSVLLKLKRQMDQDGLRLTSMLVSEVKAQLDQRAWGIRCLKCGEPSAPLWLKNPRCAEGGAMACSHTTDGKRRIHAVRTTMPQLTIVEKPDRRRAI